MYANPRWLFGVVSQGLAFVGPDEEVEVELGLEPARLESVLTAIHGACDRGRLAGEAGVGEEEADELLGQLRRSGALVEAASDREAPDGLVPLGAALAAAVRNEPITRAGAAAVCTAEELLWLPAGIGAATERRALKAFVAALQPELRQRAYCYAATAAKATVSGDLPQPGAAASALELAAEEGERIAVLAIRESSSTALHPEALERLAFEAPHRLGPLSYVRAGARGALLDDGLHVCTAGYALPNLRFASPDRRIAAGRARDSETADLLARAEAAERYAGGDPAPHRLVRAAESELDAPALTPESLERGNARQRRERPGRPPYDAEAPHLWVAGSDRAGDRRWVIADAAFNPFEDPEIGGRLTMTTSSGAAAHTVWEEARSRALAELAERDAYMWTWVQRVSRELVDLSSVGEALRARAGAVERHGFEVSLVNLTIDTLPVILCALHRSDRLSLGLSAARDPLAAVEKALEEAVSFLAASSPRPQRQATEEVASPEDHACWHQYPEQIERDRFLFGSDERIAVSEIWVPDTPADELLAAVGEPLTVDLSSSASKPFFVARVVVPELVPISFGWDKEPLGMPRLAEPKQTHDGRTLGAALDLSEAGPLEPHPFA